MDTPYPTEPTPIDLGDGKKRFLRITLRTLKGIQSQFGTIEPPENRRLEYLIALIVGGLTEHDLTEDDLLDLIDSRAIRYISEQVAKASSESSLEGKDRPTQAPEAAPVQ
jgi:hypothetical protein